MKIIRGSEIWKLEHLQDRLPLVFDEAGRITIEQLERLKNEYGDEGVPGGYRLHEVYIDEVPKPSWWKEGYERYYRAFWLKPIRLLEQHFQPVSSEYRRMKEARKERFLFIQTQPIRDDEVEIGKVYKIKLRSGVAPVRIEKEAYFGGWWGRNLRTHRWVRIWHADRLLGEWEGD